MAMIMCPDCGTSISDKALTCPYCGYAGNDPATPIADQSIGYEVVPRIKMSIERWDPKSRSLTEEMSEMPIQARRAVARWLGSLKDWESLQVVAPALVGFVKEFLGDDKVRMVADLPAEIMKMVKEGRLRFRLDSEGRIMPFVYDDKGIYKQVRLNMETVPPDVTNAMRQLETQAALSMVLAEVRSLRDQLEGIRIGLQNDRLALAEGAWDKLMQAREVEDSRLRDALIMQALSSATDAKRTLMRNFTQNANYLIEQSDIDLNRNPLALVRRLGESLNGNERIHQAAADAFDDLVQITNVVRVEGEGYSMLGQERAARACLDQFSEFIKANGLDEDTLLVIDGGLPSERKMPELVDQFAELSKRISLLGGMSLEQGIPSGLLEPYRPRPDGASAITDKETEDEPIQEEA